MGVGEQEAKVNNGAKEASLSKTLGRVSHDRTCRAALSLGREAMACVGEVNNRC